MRRIDIGKIKSISIAGFLETLGYKPIATAIGFTTYRLDLPMLHMTIKVSHKLNKWRNIDDAHKWQNIIELAKLLFNKADCKGAIDKILAYVDAVPKGAIDGRHRNRNGLSNVDIGELTDNSLISYLESRGIPRRISVEYCRQATFTLGRKTCSAVAFPNISGGYELTGIYVHSVIRPSDLSVIQMRENNDVCYVFLGFIDFLTFMTLMKRADFGDISHTLDYIILNSASNIGNASIWLSTYNIVAACLPNDTNGKKLLEKLAEMHDAVYDISGSYAGYRTLNGMHMRRLKSQSDKK